METQYKHFLNDVTIYTKQSKQPNISTFPCWDSAFMYLCRLTKAWSLRVQIVELGLIGYSVVASRCCYTRDLFIASYNVRKYLHTLVLQTNPIQRGSWGIKICIIFACSKSVFWWTFWQFRNEEKSSLTKYVFSPFSISHCKNIEKYFIAHNTWSLLQHFRIFSLSE